MEEQTSQSFDWIHSTVVVVSRRLKVVSGKRTSGLEIAIAGIARSKLFR